MDTNDQMFELMTKMYAEMQEGFKNNNTEMQEIKQRLGNVEGSIGNVEGRLSNVEERLGNVENRMGGIENRIVKMEYENQKNFTALFDGYKQNSDKLDKIEDEVSRQQEVIIRKIK